MQAHTLTHIQSHTHKHAYTCMHIHAHTVTHMQTHTHSHTHTHQLANTLGCVLSSSSAALPGCPPPAVLCVGRAHSGAPTSPQTEGHLLRQEPEPSPPRSLPLSPHTSPP